MGWPDDFIPEAREAFAFLTPLGFDRCAERAEDGYAEVRFVDRRGREVVVGACPDRLELDVTVTDPGRGTATLSELETVFPARAKRPDALPCGIFEAHRDPAKLRQVVAVLSDRFRGAAVLLLDGKGEWAAVHASRAVRAQTADAARLSREMAEAFRDARWADVTALASRLGPAAGPLDLKRADYARKKGRRARWWAWFGTAGPE